MNEHELEELNTQLYSASGLNSVQLDSRLKGMDLLEIIDDATQYVPELENSPYIDTKYTLLKN